VVRTLVYDSYGRIVQDTGGVVQPFTFTGRDLDTESGLYFYRARYYDPITGRFLSEDPIGFSAGDVNHYAYALSSPVNLRDPGGALTLTYGRSINVPGGAGSAGIAVSFPDPFTGGEFDIGFFFELGRDANAINEKSSPSSFSIGGSASLQFGIKGGSVCDLAGPGAEAGANVPITPIPGTPIPNPIGPSVGGAITANSNGFSGIELELGFGTSVFSRGTVTSTFSLRRGFIGFNGN
jgi:RHS repeat-associated protein